MSSDPTSWDDEKLMQHARAWSEVEEWRPVIGWEGAYEVSSHGRVRTVPRRLIRKNGSPLTVRGRILRQGFVPRSKRCWVALSRTGTTNKPRLVHQLVAEAFIGPRPDGLEVCHNNGDSRDNRATNLRYDTRAANMQDALKHGANHSASKTHCKQGHEFSPENTYLARGGRKRVCRICQNKAGAAYRKRKRDERLAELDGEVKAA